MKLDRWSMKENNLGWTNKHREKVLKTKSLDAKKNIFKKQQRIAIMSRSSLIQIINKTDSNAELEHHFYVCFFSLWTKKKKEENPSC